MRLFQSFHARLSALFLILVAGVGIAISWYSVKSFMMFQEEAEQKLHYGLASDLAAEWQPILTRTMDPDSLQERIHYVTGVNPKIEIYLLAADGSIKMSFTDSTSTVVQDTIDPVVIDEFIAGAPVPILGPDPLSADRQKPFSAAPVDIMGAGGYVYVILGSRSFDSEAAMIRDSYIIRGALRVIILTIVLAGIIGLFLFSLMTRRLRAMTEVVESFQLGQYDRRVHVSSTDEIGQLGESFNDMADAVVESMEDLRRTDQLRRDLIANISHDLRSPLAAIQGYLETVMIKHDSLTEVEREEYLEIVLKNTKSLNSLVGQLFELSKLDAHQVEPSFEPMSVADLVQDVIMQFKPAAEKAGVKLRVEMPDHIGLVQADIGLVERAVSNLIDNAIRYSNWGGEVCVVTNESRDAVTVEVVDQGIGIPEEDVPHIFERFYRVEKSRPKWSEGHVGGGGLGLAIAKRILDLHGSTLAVSSILHKGTTFSFSLPKTSLQLP